MSTDRADVVRGLRELADYIEANESASTRVGMGGVVVYDYVETVDQMLAQVAVLPGPWELGDDGPYMGMTRQFGPLGYRVYTMRPELQVVA
jgi:hypothetical protein